MKRLRRALRRRSGNPFQECTDRERREMAAKMMAWADTYHAGRAVR